MAGLYIHIPFCKQACSYCNFHFSTRLNQIDDMIQAIVSELKMRMDYLPERILDSVYIGGGTPSLLNEAQLDRIFAAVQKQYHLADTAEITLEANPDDLTKSTLERLYHSPVNRLSIGIQSFRETDLILMHRAHHALQAEQCIEQALETGFTNLSVDLIYGTPGLHDEAWLKNLHKIAEYQIPHLSCYALTVEPKTLLAHQIKHSNLNAPKEDQMARQFYLLLDFAKSNGFLHYEISNFAQKGHLAVHNTNYWRQKPYLGIGPSAHSYDGRTRSWNIANNAQYLKAIKQEKWPGTKEVLTPDQCYNEYVMTGLRTQWGCDIAKITDMGIRYAEEFIHTIAPFIKKHWVTENGGVYTLTNEGKLFADYISSALFMV